MAGFFGEGDGFIESEERDGITGIFDPTGITGGVGGAEKFLDGKRVAIRELQLGDDLAIRGENPETPGEGIRPPLAFSYQKDRMQDFPGHDLTFT